MSGEIWGDSELRVEELERLIEQLVEVDVVDVCDVCRELLDAVFSVNSPEVLVQRVMRDRASDRVGRQRPAVGRDRDRASVISVCDHHASIISCRGS